MNELQRITQQIADLRSRHKRATDEMSALCDRYRSEEFTAGAKTRFDDLERAVLKLNDELGPLEVRRDELVMAESSRSTRAGALTARGVVAVTGDGAAGAGTTHRAYRTSYLGDDIFDRSGLSVDNREDGGAWRDRALAAIDTWGTERSLAPEWQESAERLVDNAPRSRTGRAVAEHILAHSDPLYTRAFTKFLAHGPVNGRDLMSREEAAYFAEMNARAINEGSVSAGQAIVPPFLDPAIILTNAGIVNPFRQLATVKTITTQTWKGVTSAGVNAEWTAEAAEVTDASPTFVQPTITPVRADAYIQASFETIEDTDLATDVAMLFADARDRLEGAAFATGTGSTQPFGIVTELQLTTASRTAANTNGSIGLVDLYNMDGNLPARYRPNASWTMAKGIINLVRQATIPSLTNFSPWVDFGGAVPSKAIGYPVYEASGMQNSLSTATASNDDVIVLGDFRAGFYVVDRIGMAVAYNPLVLGSSRRPTGEVGWCAFWRVGSATVNPAAFQLLRA